MKRFTKNRKIIPVSLIILLLTGFNAINLNAQEISFTFTANHTCEYAALDSVLVENLTQGGDTTLYYPDTVLTLVLTGIDQFLTGSNNFYVSQNYPNPFETKTNIDVFLPECDDITIDVYDLLGRKVVNYEGSHESGMQHFTFFGGNS
ncbi:MAG: T9SS type A sorting domain-containing protein, partial [Bacteroidales bacterium]